MIRILAAWLLAVLAFGGEPAAQFIVELTAEPAGAVLKAGSRRAAGDVRSRVLEAQAPVRAALESSGAKVLASVATVANALIISAPADRAEALAAVPGVKRIFPVELVRPALDHAVPLHKAPEAWERLGGQGKAGAGVKIGIIDSGIDQEHPGFQDPDLVAPEGFPKAGREVDLAYTSNKVIVGRTYETLLGRGDRPTARDEDGHGTAVAMAAAGVTNTGPRGVITGVAPKAWLGSYKVFAPVGASNTAVLLKAIDDAVADGMDVLNLSLGTSINYRPEADPLWEAIERTVSLLSLIHISEPTRPY